MLARNVGRRRPRGTKICADLVDHARRMRTLMRYVPQALRLRHRSKRLRSAGVARSGAHRSRSRGPIGSRGSSRRRLDAQTTSDARWTASIGDRRRRLSISSARGAASPIITSSRRVSSSSAEARKLHGLVRRTGRKLRAPPRTSCARQSRRRSADASPRKRAFPATV